MEMPETKIRQGYDIIHMLESLCESLYELSVLMPGDAEDDTEEKCSLEFLDTYNGQP